MRIKKVIIGLIVGASLIAGQATVGAYNGNTAGSPDTYRCTQINTTPGNLGRGRSYTTCTTSFSFSNARSFHLPRRSN